MRVLHVAPSLARSFGGPTQALVGYIAASRSVGIETHVVAPAPAPDDLEWFAGQVAATPVNVFSAVGVRPLALSCQLQRWLIKHEGQFDAVHVHGLLSLQSSLPARIVRRRPLVIRPFGTMSRYSFLHRRRLVKRLYFALLDRPNLMKAAALHFTTEEEAEEARWLRVDMVGRVHIVPPPLLDAVPKGPPTRAVVGQVVLFLSRLHPKKSVELLLDAWPIVRAQLPDARLVIAGDGEAAYVSTLRARHMQMNAADRASVRFSGFVTGLGKDDELSRADLFVLPSQQENFGVAVIEAISWGIPVVVTPQVQLASFVRGQRLGVVVARTVDAIARGIVTALTDDALRRRVAHNGPLCVAAQFSPPAVGKRLASMYAAVVVPT